MSALPHPQINGALHNRLFTYTSGAGISLYFLCFTVLYCIRCNCVSWKLDFADFELADLKRDYASYSRTHTRIFYIALGLYISLGLEVPNF